MSARFSRRTASTSSALVVAGIAAVASYSHMRHLALEYGQPEGIADMLPISVDAMLVVGTLALGDGRRYRWSAWLAFWVGVTASIIANVLAAQPSAIARCISAWPAIAFLLVVEVITRGGRGRTPEPVPARRWWRTRHRPAPVVAEEPAIPDASKPDTEVAPPRPAARRAGRPSAAKKVAKAAARMPDASVDKIAAKTKVSERTVRRHLAAMSTDPEPATAGSANGAAAAHLLRTTD